MSVASVCAEAWRPTGPAATPASAPTVKRLDSSRSAPLSFNTSRMTSVSDAPIWRPTLPPSIRTLPGALQPVPVAFRHDTYPRPYCPPNPSAALRTPGMTTTHFAFAKKSREMPSRRHSTSRSAPWPRSSAAHHPREDRRPPRRSRPALLPHSLVSSHVTSKRGGLPL